MLWRTADARAFGSPAVRTTKVERGMATCVMGMKASGSGGVSSPAFTVLPTTPTMVDHSVSGSSGSPQNVMRSPMGSPSGQ